MAIPRTNDRTTNEFSTGHIFIESPKQHQWYSWWFATIYDLLYIYCLRPLNPCSPLSAFLLAFAVRSALKAAITKTSIAPWTTSRMGQAWPLEATNRSKGHHDAIAQPEEGRLLVEARGRTCNALGPPEDSEVAARTAMHHPIFSYRRFFLVHCPLSELLGSFFLLILFFLSLERSLFL